MDRSTQTGSRDAEATVAFRTNSAIKSFVQAAAATRGVLPSDWLRDVQKGLVDNRDEVETRLQSPGRGPWEEAVLPFLREHPKERIAGAVGISPRSIARYRNEHCQPHPKNREKLLWLARYHAASGEFP